MKKYKTIVAFAILLILFLLILFRGRNMADSVLTAIPEQKIENDSLLSLEREVNSLNSDAKALHFRNEQIRKDCALKENIFARKSRHIDSLPPDSQVVVFRSYTDSTSVTQNTIGITFPDSIAEISIGNIRNANHKFVELDAVETKSEMLEEFTTNQDSIIAVYEASDARLRSEITILKRQNKLLEEVMKKKDETFIRQKEKFRLELAEIGVLAILAIIF